MHHRDVADKYAVFDGQVAVLHVDGVAVILLGFDRAVAGDGDLRLNADELISLVGIAPDLFSVVDFLPVQIQRDVLDDCQHGVLNDIRQQRDGAAAARRVDGILKGRIPDIVDLSDVLLVRQGRRR